MKTDRDYGSGPAREIIRRIEADGPITFAEFMEAALYWPDGGYYTAGDGVWGKSGDYLTSLDISPAFASSIARQIKEMWSALGSPKSFHLLEAAGVCVGSPLRYTILTASISA